MKKTVTKTTDTTENTRGRKIEVTGEVISDKMDKTISVLIYRMVKHAKYGKYVKKTSVFKAHDEKNQAKTGDIVKIRETRRLSKTKRWALAEIVEAAKA
jgi:small subunit ribosomal protein S17